MIPGARVQAAIELLDQIAAAGTTAPADRLVGNYFRSRRYAGSKDRRAVTETVYDVLRRQGEYAWRAGGGDSRRLVLAHLMAAANGDLQARANDVAALFDAARFCPANLDVDEQAALWQLSRQATTEAPAWVLGNYPEWLHPALSRRFGPDLGLEMAAMQGRAAVDLRVNTLKSSRDEVMAALALDDIPVTLGALAPTALRLNSRRAMTSHPLYQGGAIEIQDEGSQLVSLLCAAQPGQQVIDYCAGGGGKSLGLAMQMANKGQIFAFDSAPQRLRPLRARLQRAGARNIQVHALADAAAIAALANLTGRADRVLLDVPCSGSGAWRRNPESKWRLTADKLSQYSASQGEILRRAAPLVAPGGRLIYATCSILMEENEDQIEGFLGESPDFGLLPVDRVWNEVLGTACPGEVHDGPYLRLTPAGQGMDGFFMAILERRANT
ncbi:MAG: RsmB/NOP family class I SAM-dependent RNA methyltransferase [Alphaproteobacteria bacterium]|nr:RsmB/NOP family class I SAM-dependent RNA methyltransferase [Alphaproteobacteria bacterium]